MEKRKDLKDIESEFTSSISIPNHKPKKQFFLCPVGLVGAGKTTVTRPISERFDSVQISSDELRKLLNKSGYDYSAVKEVIFNVIREFSAKGYSITFDMDCSNPQVKNFIDELTSASAVEALFLHITAPEEFIFEKFRKHPPTWLADNPQTMIDNYLAQKEARAKENTKFDFIFTFDTSKEDLPDQIEYCCKRIEAHLNT